MDEFFVFSLHSFTLNWRSTTTSLCLWSFYVAFVFSSLEILCQHFNETKIDCIFKWSRGYPFARFRITITFIHTYRGHQKKCCKWNWRYDTDFLFALIVFSFSVWFNVCIFFSSLIEPHKYVCMYFYRIPAVSVLVACKLD